MDISTIIGLVMGMGLIISAIMMGSGLGLFIDIPSLMIVIGGALSAVMIAYPLSDVMKIVGATLKVFMFKIEKPDDIVKNLVEISNKARKGGLLSIEADITAIKDPYLSKALQKSVDGINAEDISKIMKKEMTMAVEEFKIGWEIMGSMGSFAPAFGMVGTLIGLIQMLSKLDDPSSIGPSMSVAMITTFYGSFFANLFYIPMGNKLKRRCGEQMTNMTLMYEGVMSIREGEHPRLLEDKLNVYLTSDKKGKKEGGK